MKHNVIKKLISLILVITIFMGTTSTISFVAASDVEDGATALEIGDIENETNGKTFTLRRDYYELLINHSLYGTKDYIAYPWGEDFYIWFFHDDISNVKFNMWRRGSSNFGLHLSEDLTFTEYVYDRDTLEFIKSWDRNISKSNVYNFGYDFIASFNIYTDSTYSAYFYEAENSVDNIEFKPLEPDEAKDFLKYISKAGALVNIEEALPEYYNFLIGEIQNPEEELRIKVSFLTYLYYCLDAQLAQNGERIEWGTTYLMKWISEDTEAASTIYSEVKDSIVDSLEKTIAENATLPIMQIAGINILTAVIDYADVFIVSLGSITAVREKDEILYLLAYKRLLEAKATNDEPTIIAAESDCFAILNDATFGVSAKKIERFAGYLFTIEQSLPE